MGESTSGLGMNWFLGVWAVAATVALIFLASYAIRQRQRMKGRPAFWEPPIPQIAIDQVDPIFTAGELGPDRRSEITFVGNVGRLSSTSDTESWILAAMAKRAKRQFELGTCTGRTTYLLAANAPDDAVIDTLTLGPDDISDYQFDTADPDAKKWRDIAVGESTHTQFYYEDTPVAHKVRQHFGDSKKFDETSFRNQMDLIFVDGSHAYSYVKADSEKALAMVAPGGFIFWHDYSPRCPGVFKGLNELAARVPLKHIKGTTLVYHRRGD